MLHGRSKQIILALKLSKTRGRAGRQRKCRMPGKDHPKEPKAEENEAKEATEDIRRSQREKGI